MRNIIFIFIITLTYSCSTSKSIFVDNSKPYLLNSDCGVIEIRSFSLEQPDEIRVNISQKFISGDYIMYPSSLKIELDNEKYHIKDIEIYRFDDERKDIPIKDKMVRITEDENINISFKIKLKEEIEFSADREKIRLMILPGEYIICDEEPVIEKVININL